MREVTYRPAPKGLGTSFTESELPPDYAATLTNRFINSSGGLEKRQGIVTIGNPIPGNPLVSELHEFVSKTGEATLFASSEGKIYKYDGSADWTLVYTTTSTDRLRDVQMGDKLIFFNGKDRPFYTDDSGATFNELLALIEEGKNSSASTVSITDADITDWLTETEVNTNDLVWNVTKGGFGVVTNVAAGSVTITQIASGATGLGKVDVNQASGDYYRIIDLVELNIIPTDTVPDNVATTDSATTTTLIGVSGVNFATTDIRVGDFVYNTTRSAILRVEAIATAITVTSCASQTSGDSLVFLKSAMPIPQAGYVHFNRLYLLDARDRRKVRVSGAGDAQDFTTDGATLDPISLNYDLAAAGDIIQQISSFQQRLVFGGKRAIYVYQGTTPIGTESDLVPVGAFRQGTVSDRGLLDIGNDILFAAEDGVQSVRVLVNDELNRVNVSEPVRVTLRDLIADTAADEIQLIHYPRRSWAILKVGTQLWVYNYTTGVNTKVSVFGGSFSLFDGPFAQQMAYLVRSDGTLICAGASGRVYQFDTGVYSDNGAAIRTDYKTGWLTMEKSGTVRQKQGHFLRPLLQASADVSYSVTIEGGWNYGESLSSTSSVTTGATATIGNFTVGADAIGGSTTQSTKIPLRWRGEVARLSISTESTAGPDIIGRYTFLITVHGRR
jgi:hypothetical protein